MEATEIDMLPDHERKGIERVADEVRRSGRPRLIKRGDEALAMVVPLPDGRQAGGYDSDRFGPGTFLVGFGAVAPENRPEDWGKVREAVEQAIADEVMERPRR